MKLMLAKTLLIFSLAFTAQPLTALTVGRVGKSYQIEGMKWQNVVMREKDFHMKARIPGSPMSGYTNGLLEIKSEYRDCYYIIQTKMQSEKKLPKTLKALAKKLGVKDMTTFRKIPSKKKNVHLAANFSYTEDGIPGLTRVYVTKKKIYSFMAYGQDLSLANDFFDSVVFKKG